jgi:hypothetical protein
MPRATFLTAIALAACSAPASPEPRGPGEPVTALAVDAAPAPPSDASAAISVDKEKAAVCQKLLDAINADTAGASATAYLEAARCFYDANAIGAAIMIWKRVEDLHPRDAGREATIALAEAYERANTIEPRYHEDAASFHERVAKVYASGNAEAVSHMQRAMCLRVAGKMVDKALRDAFYLEKALRQPAIPDPAAFCSTPGR